MEKRRRRRERDGLGRIRDYIRAITKAEKR